MKPLASNSDLYEYLLGLEATLRRQGASTLADAVAHAIHQAGDISTVFLGESRIALRRLAEHEQGVLSEQERNDLLDVLAQIDETFDSR